MGANSGCLPILLIAAGAWAIFGSPKKDVANFFWPDSAAPWETVDAFYYPSRSNLTVFRRMDGFDSVDGCRLWVSAAAAGMGDPSLERGDYECAVGKIGSMGDLGVYRLTVR